MKQLTIRGVPDDLLKALQLESKRRGTSLNQTTLDVLCQSLGLRAAASDNELAKLSGTWSSGDLKSFEENTQIFEQIDPELWN